ncbi:hypothetical protein AAY473_013373 [Plecturocebus cupreus]
MRNPVSTKNTKICQACKWMPVVPATPEAEAGESLEPRRRKLQDRLQGLLDKLSSHRCDRCCCFAAIAATAISHLGSSPIPSCSEDPMAGWAASDREISELEGASSFTQSSGKLTCLVI